MSPADRLRLCVIGNSHVIPLRASWSDVAELDYVDPTFFCASGRKLEALKIEGSAIVPGNRALAEALKQTARATERIVPAEYDAVLVVGLQTGIRPLWELYATHRLPEHARPRHVVISPACLDAAIDGLFARSVAVKVFTLLRELGMESIFLVPDPNTPEQYAVNRPMLADPAVNAFVAAAFDRGLARLAAHHGVTVIHQRPETISDGFTLARYSMSTDDEAEGRETSRVRMLHASKAFGMLAAQDVAAALKACAPPDGRSEQTIAVD